MTFILFHKLRPSTVAQKLVLDAGVDQSAKHSTLHKRVDLQLYLQESDTKDSFRARNITHGFCRSMSIRSILKSGKHLLD